jgi:thioredoxin-related protein
MTVIHFDSANIDVLNKCIKNKNIFLLIYMEGCEPCNRTKPEWMKLENILKKKDPNVIIGDVEQSNLSNVPNLKYIVRGYPSMLNITNKGKKIKTIEDDNINERNIDSFIKWIKKNKQKSKTLRLTNKNKKKTKKNPKITSSKYI